MEKDTLRPPLCTRAALACWLWLAVLTGAAEPPTARADPPTTGTGTAVAAAQPVERHQLFYIIPFTPVPDGIGGPLVKVRLNGKVDATFLIDTGSNADLISGKVADSLGLARSPVLAVDGKPFSMFGKPAVGVTFNRMELPTDSQGNMVIQPVDGQFIVADDKRLLVATGLTADGVIGANFLENFAVSFDFSAYKMILLQPGVLSEAQARQLGCAGPGGAELPLIANGEDQFFVPALLDTGTASRSAELIVDTGGKLTIIPRDAAKALSLKPARQQPVLGGSFGYVTLSQTQVPSLSLGGINLLDRPVLYPGKQDYPAILGMDILKGYKVLLDYPAHKMYLMPNMTLAPVQIKPTAPTPTTAPAPAAPPPTAAPAAPATPPVPKKP